MARTVCMAKKTGQVRERGKASIEWHDANGKPQYYCYGYINMMTDELLDVRKSCRDHADKAQEDLERANLVK